MTPRTRTRTRTDIADWPQNRKRTQEGKEKEKQRRKQNTTGTRRRPNFQTSKLPNFQTHPPTHGRTTNPPPPPPATRGRKNAVLGSYTAICLFPVGYASRAGRIDSSRLPLPLPLTSYLLPLPLPPGTGTGRTTPRIVLVVDSDSTNHRTQFSVLVQCSYNYNSNHNSNHSTSTLVQRSHVPIDARPPPTSGTPCPRMPRHRTPLTKLTKLNYTQPWQETRADLTGQARPGQTPSVTPNSCIQGSRMYDQYGPSYRHSIELMNASMLLLFLDTTLRGNAQD